jgi:very-short-patch-repair endonuclease
VEKKLKLLEKYWYDCLLHKEYKMTTKGYKHTKETKRKLCKFSEEQELQICEEYFSEEKPSANILGKKYNCDPITIRNVIKKNGYKLRNRSECHIGQKAWNKNIPHSETTKEKIKNKLKGNKNTLGKHWKLSDQTKRKQSIAKKGKKRIGYIPWNIGIPRSEETKQKIRNKKLGKKRKPFSIEHIQKMKEKALQRIQNYPGPYKDTKPELKMKEILTELNIPFEHQFRLGNYLYDFHLLNTNILIEVDRDYWHSNPKKYSKLSKQQKDKQQRDNKHNEIAKINGFILLRFWESDILKNEEEVKIELLNRVN